jgi:hypothetical protein
MRGNSPRCQVVAQEHVRLELQSVHDRGHLARAELRVNRAGSRNEKCIKGFFHPRIANELS